MAENVNGAVQKILVVIDPTTLVQPALEKAEWIAGRNGSSLHLLCCIWDDDVGDDPAGSSALLTRSEAWLERIADSCRAKGLEAVVEVCWDRNWRERIGAVALDQGVDLIVKSVSRHSMLRRRLMRTSDWIVLRDASCPTLLVDIRRPANPKVILAAVKRKAADETHSKLNDRVLELGRRLEQAFQGELHVVTAHTGDDIHFDRQRFADSCELPRSRVHAAEGSAPKGIAEVAGRIGADLLVVGCATNSVPERGVIIGDTAQRVIDEVTTDIIVVPAA